MRWTIVCRFGEIFLKGANRYRFDQALVNSVRRALEGVPGAVVRTPHGRVMADVPESEVEEAATRLTRIFGLVSLSPARVLPPDIQQIHDAAIAATRAAIARDPALGRSFKVEARRSDKSFPLTSYEIARDTGSQIAQATGIPVDVHKPALTVGIEVSATDAYVFAETRAGPGGLPVGSSGRALLLLSGGIDSPVAGWLAAKRGLALEAVYFHSPPFVGEKSKDKVLALGRVLARWQALERIHVVNFTDVQKRLREAGPAELAVVLYRRMMMRVADRLADRLKAASLVTGENVGQVASQTVPNMTAIEAAARHLVLRPLVTYDKTETIALARRIETFDISALPYDDCCSLFVPAHPATSARAEDALRAERTIEVEKEAETLAGSAEEIRLEPQR